MVRKLGKITAVGIALTLLLTYMKLVRPVPRDGIQHADAVVVLAGDETRLATGVALAEKVLGQVLVISNGERKGWKAANALCRSHQRFEVLCPSPATDSTAGEAEMVRRISTGRKWRTVVLVSSNYHLLRARSLFHRCLTAKVRVYSSEPDRLGFSTWYGALMEWPKRLVSVINRDC